MSHSHATSDYLIYPSKHTTGSLLLSMLLLMALCSHMFWLSIDHSRWQYRISRQLWLQQQLLIKGEALQEQLITALSQQANNHLQYSSYLGEDPLVDRINWQKKAQSDTNSQDWQKWWSVDTLSDNKKSMRIITMVKQHASQLVIQSTLSIHNGHWQRHSWRIR